MVTPTPEVPLPEPWNRAGTYSSDPLPLDAYTEDSLRTYAEAHAARAVELERARVVSLVEAHEPEYDRVLDYVRCGDCRDERSYADHLTDLITRADREESPDE